MTYLAVKFTNEYPSSDIVEFKNSHDGYGLVKILDPNYKGYLAYYHTELTEFEYQEASKFYGECREYRSAYSDVEGLEPDPDSLSEGKRKTKVYKTPEIEAATVSLMKKITRLRIKEVFDERNNRDGDSALQQELNACETVKDVCWFLEHKFGQEIPWPLAREHNLIDPIKYRRMNPPVWGVKF